MENKIDSDSEIDFCSVENVENVKNVDNVENVENKKDVEPFNINYRDYNGNSALHWVAIYDNRNILELLLRESNIDVNLQNNNGNTALILAAQNNCDLIVRSLLSHPNIDINILNKQKKSVYDIIDQQMPLPLTQKCSSSLLNCFQYIVEHPKLDIKHKNNCLIKAAAYGLRDVVRHLIRFNT